MTSAGPPPPPSTSFHALVATDPAVSPPRRSLGSIARGQSLTLATLIGAGVVLGLLWAVLVPFAQGHSDADERAIAADGTLALLGLVAGFLTAALLGRRAGALWGRRADTPSALGATVVLIGAVLGSAVSVGVGVAVGAPPPAASGSALVWPLTAAAVTLVRMLFSVLVFPE